MRAQDPKHIREQSDTEKRWGAAAHILGKEWEKVRQLMGWDAQERPSVDGKHDAAAGADGSPAGNTTT
jgi:hypothetical protein